MTEPLKSDLLSRQASLGLAGDLIWGVKAIAIERRITCWLRANCPRSL
jgi:hypothetical protein